MRHTYTHIQARERMQLACLKLQVEATDNWSLYFLQTLEGKFIPSEVNSGGLTPTILISTSVKQQLSSTQCCDTRHCSDACDNTSVNTLSTRSSHRKHSTTSYGQYICENENKDLCTLLTR